MEQSNISASDLPAAESTQIEETAKTPLKRLRLRLANKFGFRNAPSSPVEVQTSKRNTNNPITLNKLDPQVYLDTQSNGFASRVVKYHEASEAKTRGISNKIYRRPGDFPIVNLDKSEISLNQKQVHARPKVSKINIAPPINLVSASERSIIFRTGKSGGSYEAADKIGPIEGRKPLHTPQSSHDEPIVPTSSDFNNDPPAKLPLEELDKLSRKRIHCDEIDGETNKKHRHDNTSNDCDHNSTSAPNAAKRTRDRTSPSFTSTPTEIQQKRYKNNDILSSLSSSMIMSTPKRTISNDGSTPTKIVRFNKDFSKDSSERNDSLTASQKPPESSRVGTSNSDLPLHRSSSDEIKPVTKSMSDGYVPKQPSQPPKAPKFTLFNRDYSAMPVVNNNGKKDADDDENGGISFVKPKAKASTLFSTNRNRDQKSKLAMMLSFLRGDESIDEVDSVGTNKSSAPKSSVDESKSQSVSSASANLTTNTSVTFSTATTTSVLSAPVSDSSKITVIEPLKQPNKESNDTNKPIIPPATVAFSSTIPSSSPKVTFAMPSAQSENDLKPKPLLPSTAVSTSSSPVVTFNIPSTEQQSTTVAPSTPSLSTASPPRLGGFTFSATPPPAYTAPATNKPAVSEGVQPVQSIESKAPPTFSFGTSNVTSATQLPTFTPPSFGAIATTAKTEASTLQTQPSALPGIFSFGSPTVTAAVATKPSALSTNTVAFGIPSSTTSSTSSTATLGSNASMFSFGATAKTAAPSLPSVTTTSASTGSSTFVFGSNTPNTTNTFGLNTTTTTTNSATSLNQAPAVFAFGNATTNTPNKPEMSAFQFGNTATNKPSAPIVAFGAPPATTNAAPAATAIFGAANANANTNTASSTTQSAFAFGATKTEAETKTPLFGTPTTQTATGFGAFSSTQTFGQTNPPPAFGANVVPPTTNPTNLFGNVSNVQNTPVFGAAQTKTNNTFGMASNPNTATPVFGSQNQANSTFGSSINPPAFGATNNLFGSTPANTQSQPTFATASPFSTPTTAANQNQTTNSAFGASPSLFAFGQTQSPQTPATTASTGLFGTANTNTNTSSNAPFVFGQANVGAQSPTPSTGLFGAKPTDNPNANNASLTAPPAFGSTTSSAFNFTAKPMFGGNHDESKPQPFSFNAAPAPAVAAFGSAPGTAAPQFGNTNGLGSSFSFNATSNPTDASKPFNFGGPATAPAAAPAGFSFSAPNANAFQFNATPQPPANIFSIGPSSGTNTTKTGRPMRTATRRIK